MSFLLIIPWGICSQVDYFSLFFLKKKKKDFINLAQISTSTHCKSLKIVYYHGNLEYTVIEIYYIQVKSQEGSFKWWFNSPAFLKVCECYENVTQRLSLHWWTGLLFSPNGASSFSFDSHLRVLGFVISRYFEKSAWGSLLVLCDSPHCGDCWAMSLVATSTIWGQPHSPHTVHSHGHSTDQLQCVPPSPSQDRTRLWFVIQTNPSFEVLFARPASIPYSELSKCHRACRALLACTEDDSHRHSCHCHPPQEWRAVVLEHLQLVLESVPTGSEQSSCDMPPPWDSQETNCSPMNASCDTPLGEPAHCWGGMLSMGIGNHTNIPQASAFLQLPWWKSLQWAEGQKPGVLHLPFTPDLPTSSGSAGSQGPLTHQCLSVPWPPQHFSSLQDWGTSASPLLSQVKVK